MAARHGCTLGRAEKGPKMTSPTSTLVERELERIATRFSQPKFTIEFAALRQHVSQSGVNPNTVSLYRPTLASTMDVQQIARPDRPDAVAVKYELERDHA